MIAMTFDLRPRPNRSSSVDGCYLTVEADILAD